VVGHVASGLRMPLLGFLTHFDDLIGHSYPFIRNLSDAFMKHLGGDDYSHLPSLHLGIPAFWAQYEVRILSHQKFHGARLLERVQSP
jgi:hypothetical protein